MAVERSTKRIRPSDFELSQVQDNLGNALDGVLSTIAKGSFRRTLEMGTFWVGNGPMPTRDTPMIRTVSQSATSTSQTMVAYALMPVAGSVLSLQGVANGAVSDKWKISVYNNGKPLGLTTQTSTSVTYATAAQGKYPFAAGDVLQVYICGNSSTINQSFSASIDVESQA